ncbi:histone deacetylase superfamily protein [Gorgonomyces haynaldii]|nr:histone deacetylase superfamily protein [Gorgonomyces haynaldii]
MKVFYSEKQLLHNPKHEMLMGRVVPFREVPARATSVLAKCKELGMEILEPKEFGEEWILKVHTQDYLDFLKRAYKEWTAGGGNPDGVIPDTYAVRLDPRFDRRCTSCIGRPGYYMFDGTCVIMEGTYEGTYAAVQVALSGAQEIVNGAPSAFALCRPPGHHANGSIAGGYCFFNTAAIATKYLIEHLGKVAILDIDFHHGNGTQEIFYDSSNPLYCSLHGDPFLGEYPYYWGHADETGSGEGKGFNLNVPLPKETNNEQYLKALDVAIARINQYQPKVLVVSLGVDTFERDPVGGFKVTSECYTLISQKIRSIGVPTLFVMEGGYAIDAIGDNVTRVLSSFH